MTEFTDVRVGPTFTSQKHYLQWVRSYLERGVDFLERPLHPAHLAELLAENARELAALDREP